MKRERSEARSPRQDLDERRRSAEEIAAWTTARLAEELGLDAEEIDVRIPFTRFGLVSSESVVLVGELEEWLGEPLPATLLWDYPTIARLSVYLAEEHAGHA